MLQVGNKLLDPNGKILLVEDVTFETTKEPTTVYNFQVEDFHTYFVGCCGVLVHNASYNEKVAQLKANREQGTAFEKEVKTDIQRKQTDVVEQITVKTKSGTKTRLDFIGVKENKIVLTEAKSSHKAPLTSNQAVGFPEIAESGAIVVGKGKGAFSGGTLIPPTEVSIIRPKNLGI